MPAGQPFGLSLLHDAFTLHRFRIAHHHRKGLHRAVLERPEPFNSGGIAGITAQMESTNALDRGDLSFHDRTPDCCDRLCAAYVCADQIDLRAACIAADGLCIVAAGHRIFIFAAAFRTHREFRHTRAFPVVGHRIKNRQARAALGAVDERMQVAPVLRVKQLPAAFVAGGDVGRDKDIAVFPLGFDNGKFPVFRCILHRLHFCIEDHGALRRFLCNGFLKCRKGLRFPLRIDLHIRSLVRHRTANAVPSSRDRGKRTESDTLYNAEKLHFYGAHVSVLNSALTA